LLGLGSIGILFAVGSILSAIGSVVYESSDWNPTPLWKTIPTGIVLLTLILSILWVVGKLVTSVVGGVR
jgi:hypothetical protein